MAESQIGIGGINALVVDLFGLAVSGRWCVPGGLGSARHFAETPPGFAGFYHPETTEKINCYSYRMGLALSTTVD